LNHRELANPHGDDPYLDQMLDEKMGDQMKMRRDDWMGAMNSREAFFHPFRSPLFKFNFDAFLIV
jgi:hypothetical protein